MLPTEAAIVQIKELMSLKAQGIGPLYSPLKHTYIHTYMHACIHTYIHVYISVHRGKQ